MSWYEAVAYAEFAGKSLPTVYHWVHAMLSANRFQSCSANDGNVIGQARLRTASRYEPSTISDSNLKVILLGTAGGPTFDAQRLDISTLVLAGPEKLLFDCGRGLTTGMTRLAITLESGRPKQKYWQKDPFSYERANSTQSACPDSPPEDRTRDRKLGAASRGSRAR